MTVNGHTGERLGNTGTTLPDLIELNNPKHAFIMAQSLRKPYVYGTDFAISRQSGNGTNGGVSSTTSSYGCRLMASPSV